MAKPVIGARKLHSHYTVLPICGTFTKKLTDKLNTIQKMAQITKKLMNAISIIVLSWCAIIGFGGLKCHILVTQSPKYT